MTRRSLLFSPGDQPGIMRKAARTDADVLVFDLEDAVAPSAKDAARTQVRTVLADPEFDPDAEVCVRVNARPAVAAADLDAVCDETTRLDAVVAPKVGSAADIERVAAMLADRGRDVPVFALCESAAGVLHAEEIAAVDPVHALLFGAEDLAADIGATRTAEGTEVLHAREHVVLAAAAAGVDAIDTLYTDIEDTEGLAADTRFGIELGYDGKICVHPAQVTAINQTFTPDTEQVEWARRVLAARQEAEIEERGVFRVDGEMVDAPLIRQAERVRERARAAGVWAEE